MKQHIFVMYDFETMTNRQSIKTRGIKENKDKTYTLKTGEHITTGFAVAIYYSDNIKCRKNDHFCYRGEDCLGVFDE